MRSRNLLLALAALASILFTPMPAHADLTAQQVWQKAVQRIKSMKDYTLSYNYSGHKGEFVFEYAVVRPDQVKTRIVKGDNAGAVLIYNPSEYGNQVRARKGILGKGLSLNDPKVANSPVIQPVFDMLLEKTRNPSSIEMTGSDTVYGHPVYVLTITAQGGKQIVGIDKTSFDVLHWKYTDGEGTNDRVFYNIQINNHPRIDF